MRKLSISAFICFSLLALSSPAYAHNQLIDTYPTDGSTVEAGAVNVDLTFEEAPLELPFGEGNLIAVAKAETGEQLGAACAYKIDNHLTTTLHLSEPGKYKVLWRQVSDDGHVVSGEFTFTLVNNSNYTTDKPGNECIDSNGNEIDVKKQDLLSKTDTQNHGFETGLVWGAVFIILGSLVGSVLIRRRQK
jgi:methionine-rich copper-binding protein CopC